MKTYVKKAMLALSLALLCLPNAKAQTHEFAPVGTEWYYEHCAGMFSTGGYMHIEAVSDTMIDNIHCTKLTKKIHGCDYYGGLFQITLENEYVTQKNDSVMIFRDGDFHLFFDFGASVGDTWTLVGIPGICEQAYGLAHVVETGIETISGHDLKYVKILDDQYSYWGYGNCSGLVGDPCTDTVKIVEKIGPIKHYLLPNQKCESDDGEGGPLRCYVDDELGYMNFSSFGVNCGYINEQYQSVDDSPEVYQPMILPNPCSSVTCVVMGDDKNNDVTLYDCHGRMVCQFTNVGKTLDLDMSGFTPGLYFLMVKNNSNTYNTKIIKLRNI